MINRKKISDDWMMYHEICQRQRFGWKPLHIAGFLGLDISCSSCIVYFSRNASWLVGTLFRSNTSDSLFGDYTLGKFATMVVGKGCDYDSKLSIGERLPFLSANEEVVPFFTGGWYQFSPALK